MIRRRLTAAQRRRQELDAMLAVGVLLAFLVMNPDAADRLAQLEWELRREVERVNKPPTCDDSPTRQP